MEVDIIVDARLAASEISKLGRLAESQGVRALWTSNILGSRDPFSNLAILARDSKKIRMGPIAVSPYELHPLKMANSLLTLNEIANGRANIVVGGGGGVAHMMGVLPANKTVPPVKECVDILKLASKGKEFSYSGASYHITNFPPTWVRAKPPMIYVGANKDKMIAMSAEEADGIMMTDMPPSLAREIVQKTKTALSKRKSSAKGYRINNFFAMHLNRDEKVARKEAESYLSVRGALRRKASLAIGLTEEECDVVEANKQAFAKAHRYGGPIEGVPQTIIDKLVEGLTLTSGTKNVDSIVEKFVEFKKTGLTEIAIRIHTEPALAIRTLGKKVIPAVK